MEWKKPCNQIKYKKKYFKCCSKKKKKFEFTEIVKDWECI